MKTQFIGEITQTKEGEWVEDIFLVKGRQFSMRKDGTAYLVLKVADKTGVMDAKLWDNVKEFSERFAEDDFFRIKGVITNYQGTKGLSIKYVERIDEGNV